MASAARGTPDEVWSALVDLRAGKKIRDVAGVLKRGTRTVKKWKADYDHCTSPEELRALLIKPNRYLQIISTLFEEKWSAGVEEFVWSRSDLTRIATALKVTPPDNLGDAVYAFRHGRQELPDNMKAAERACGKQWLLLPNGKSGYRFRLAKTAFLDPDRQRRIIKIPDSTPQIIARNAAQDEQAVLARIRYCRLVDMFMSLASYQLQSHRRMTVQHFSSAQTELDEIYVGVNGSGAQFVIPIQAKSPAERIGAVQIITDHYACAQEFPNMIARTLAAQTMAIERHDSFGDIYTIALIEAEVGADYEVRKVNEEHFQLLPAAMISDSELADYRTRYESRRR